MIIFGSKGRTKTTGNGQFHCPQCQAKRQYEYKEVRRYFTLYFIPLIPLDKLGEYVECSYCHTTFKPEVLSMKPKPRQVSPADLLNATGKRLQEGAPVEMVVRDLAVLGLERDVAQKMVDGFMGNEHHTCESCALTYADTVTVCTECNQPLTIPSEETKE